jgi:periplasmic protein TonB
MSNISSLADQLDDAIEMMMAAPESAPPKVDLKIGELLGIAAELRLLPDPAFRAALKEELVGRSVLATPAVMEWKPARNLEEPILPTLFGGGLGNYPVHRENFAISAVVHAALLAMVAASGLWLTKDVTPRTEVSSHLLTEVSSYRLPAPADRGNSGGGAREKLPESKGSLPHFAREQLTPPTVVVPWEQPKLAEEMTLLGPPELSKPQTSQIGNPLAEIIGSSNGNGSGGGIGTGHGGGIGSGVGSYRVGSGVSAPIAIYDPEPEYTDEARQAKFQGTVMLWVVIGTDGRPRDIRVQRSLGMGLDEKAIEAVRRWKFRPGMKDGVPAAVQVSVEVDFRLF